MSKPSYETRELYSSEMEDHINVAQPRPATRKMTVRPSEGDDPERARYLKMTPAERAADRRHRAAMGAEARAAAIHARSLTPAGIADLLDAAEARCWAAPDGKEAYIFYAGFSCWRVNVKHYSRIVVHVGNRLVAHRSFDVLASRHYKYNRRRTRLAAEAQAAASAPGALRVKSVSPEAQGDFAEAA